MHAANRPNPGAWTREASGAQRDDREQGGPGRFSETTAGGLAQDADACDKTLFCRLPSPLQLALLYRLHAGVYRQPGKLRTAGRRPHG
jgi:hypothetical protein